MSVYVIGAAALFLILVVLFAVDGVRQRRTARKLRELTEGMGRGSFAVRKREAPEDPHPRPYRVAHRKAEDP
jgi:hypothetical protein